MVFSERRHRPQRLHTRRTAASDYAMITSILLIIMLHTGLSAKSGYEELEKTFRLKLGLSEKPVVGGNLKIPAATLNLLKLASEQKLTTHFPLPGLHTTTANTARIYHNKGSAPLKAKAKKYRLQFDIDSIPEREQVKSAEVRFTMKYDQALQNEEFIHVVLHDIIQPGTKGLSKPILRIIDSKSMNLSRISKTESFDVTPYVERLWKNNFKDNHGMIVQCVTESGSHTHLLSVFDFVSPENTLLLVYTDDGTSQKSTLERLIQRSKRSADPPAAPQKKTKKKREICQRYPMYVNFTEIGFSDWIQAPGGYDAFYCKGECKFPLANHLNATNHAVMQTLINSFNSSKVPRVCCVPTKMSTQTLLYKDDDGKLVVKNYQEMTVDECGCR
ncbi:protein decapentaplegic-like [Myzus persicae]|uniref:protein decapentaplegic-like n=1 Tax=Myzus persicae TaxID=13164 RepID=UPI000B932267|nr:protein decapentaplegic-like [Myzus persicae]